MTFLRCWEKITADQTKRHILWKTLREVFRLKEIITVEDTETQKRMKILGKGECVGEKQWTFTLRITILSLDIKNVHMIQMHDNEPEKSEKINGPKGCLVS